MARFDPHNYPERLAFEASARRLRACELERLESCAVRGAHRLAVDSIRHVRRLLDSAHLVPHRRSN